MNATMKSQIESLNDKLESIEMTLERTTDAAKTMALRNDRRKLARRLETLYETANG